MKRTLWTLGCWVVLAQAHAAPDLGKALEGTSWRWDSYKLAGVTPESKVKTPITLGFRRGGAGWSAGCNATGGAYLFEKNFLSVPNAVGTAKACGGGRGSVEIAMTSFMNHGVFVKLEMQNGSPSRLILYSANSSSVLILVPAQVER